MSFMSLRATVGSVAISKRTTKFIRDCFGRINRHSQLFVAMLLAMTQPYAVWADAGTNNFQLTCTAFEDNAVIPKKYTCDGQDVNPPLVFKSIPANAKSLALTVSDPDAPMGTWSHWVVYNIPPNTLEIKEDTNPGKEVLNDFGKNAYGGPCPPSGKTHHYIFHAYALDCLLNIKDGPTINDVEKSLQGHIIAQSLLVGTYQK